jgi:carbon monoxide dehydrogenase subunit G
VPIAWHHDFDPSEEVLIAMAPEVLWPILSSPATFASWVPGAVLTKSGEGDVCQGTMRVKFGPKRVRLGPHRNRRRVAGLLASHRQAAEVLA